MKNAFILPQIFIFTVKNRELLIDFFHILNKNGCHFAPFYENNMKKAVFSNGFSYFEKLRGSAWLYDAQSDYKH